MARIVFTEDEIKKLRGTGDRFKIAMEKSGYVSDIALCNAIAKKRGDSPHQSIVSKIKNQPDDENEFYNVSIGTLLIFAEEFGVSIDYLLGRTDYMDLVDSMEVAKLGLDSDSLYYLQEIKLRSDELKKAKENKCTELDPKQDKGYLQNSQYCLNAYEKELFMLNFLIHHMDPREKDTGDYDFLTTLYQSVMLDFSGSVQPELESILLSIRDEAIKSADNKIAKKVDEVFEHAVNGKIKVRDKDTFDEAYVGITGYRESLNWRLLGMINKWHNNAMKNRRRLLWDRGNHEHFSLDVFYENNGDYEDDED